MALHVAARNPAPPDVPMVTLATAHPAKFPEAVREATGIDPRLPPAFADLHTLPERCVTLPNDLSIVEAGIEDALKAA